MINKSESYCKSIFFTAHQITSQTRQGEVIRLPKPVMGEEIDSWMEVYQEKVTKGTLNILTQQYQRAAEEIKLTPEEKKKVVGHIRVIIDDAGTTMSIDEVVTLLDSRTNSLARLVAAAERRMLAPETTSATS
jgi:hypothetical protein